MRKKWLSILIGVALLCLCAVALADVELNETNFPDEYFRKYVKQLDTDGDGSFSEDEIAAVTRINCRAMQISSLQGVECFTALTELWCDTNQLTSLDVSRNTALIFQSGMRRQTGFIDVRADLQDDFFCARIPAGSVSAISLSAVNIPILLS